MTELKDAIAVSKCTATDPDDIHYQMLKHLPESALDSLLQPLGIKLSALSRPWGLNSHWERC